MDHAEGKKLFSFEFVALNFVSFFGFCNIAVFYSFYTYLGRIGVPVEWRGFLVGLEPMTAFALRLVLVPLVHAGNAARVMLASLVMIMVALCSYQLAVTVPALALLRIFHGLAFVLLVSSSMALVVNFIPGEKSGQGFSVVSITTLVPYAIMPPLTEVLLRYAVDETRIYAAVSVLAVPGVILLYLLRPRLEECLGRLGAPLIRRPALSEIRENLKRRDVLLILAVNLLVFLSHTTVFYFMKDFSLRLGLGDVGMFFTILTLVMIGVRLLGGILFDKVSKRRTLQIFMPLLVLCFILFGRIESRGMYYLMAGAYGLCLGVIFPLLNAAMFLASPPHLRVVNSNLMLFMMDAGFFLGPYAAGALLAAGFSFRLLFNICAGLIFFGFFFLLMLRAGGPAPRGDAVEPPSSEGGAIYKGDHN